VATLSGHEAEANCTIPKQNNSLAFNHWILHMIYMETLNMLSDIIFRTIPPPMILPPSAYIKEQGPFADVGYAELALITANLILPIT